MVMYKFPLHDTEKLQPLYVSLSIWSYTNCDLPFIEYSKKLSLKIVLKPFDIGNHITQHQIDDNCCPCKSVNRPEVMAMVTSPFQQLQ